MNEPIQYVYNSILINYITSPCCPQIYPHLVLEVCLIGDSYWRVIPILRKYNACLWWMPRKFLSWLFLCPGMRRSIVWTIVTVGTDLAQNDIFKHNLIIFQLLENARCFSIENFGERSGLDASLEGPGTSRLRTWNCGQLINRELLPFLIYRLTSCGICDTYFALQWPAVLLKDVLN